MIPAVLAAILGLLLGLAVSRRPAALLLPRLRGLWLLIPTLTLAVLPQWLDRTAPALIWTDDRQLLLAILLLRQSLLIFLIVINLLPHHLPLPPRQRLQARRLATRMADGFKAATAWFLAKPVLVRLGLVPARTAPTAADAAAPGKAPAARRVQVSPPQRPATRGWHRLPLLGLLLAAALQAAVLLQNDGYMPLTPAYLEGVTNPALAAGIRNGALLLHSIVGPETALPALALQYRLPLVERLFPGAFPYYGLADLIGAACLFLCLFLQFFGRFPGEAPRPIDGKLQAS